MRIAGACAALLIAATAAQAQVAQNEPTCRALRQGEALITKIVFADGYAVEAPWQVVRQTQSGHGTAVKAVLRTIIETEPASGRRQATPLPEDVEMTFRGSTPSELLSTAASIWCATVLQARDPHHHTPGAWETPLPGRILM